jgi:hypothetical protein
MAEQLVFTILDDPALYDVEIFYDPETAQWSFRQGGVPFVANTLYQTTSGIIDQLSDFEYCNGETRNYFIGQRFYPYARLVTDAFSPYCQVLSCDLSVIELTLTHETRTEAKNGSVEISAYSKYPPIQYSLDNVTFQSDNIFSLLEPGNYTAYTRDRRNCTAQQAFEILAFAGPQPRWRVTYYDLIYNRQHVLTIYQQDYEGEVEETPFIKGQSNPLYIETKGRNDDRLKPIRGSEATVSLICTSQYQYAEIFSSDERKHLVEHTIDGEINFRGWVMPEIWQEAYNSPPYPVSFSATDGLGTLKEIEFLTLAGEDVTGYKTQLDVIVQCLLHLDVSLPITTAIHTYETRMSYGDADDPLTQTLVDAAQYKGKNCGQVLESILIPYRARIYQQLGGWHIVQVDIPGKATGEPILYESEFKAESFQKQCEGGGGSWVEFSVPQGFRLSPVSVEEANILRDAEFAALGQAYANETGTCPTEPEEETGKLYLINSSLYEVRVDNNVDTSLTITNDSTPTLVEDAEGPLLFSGFRIRKPGLVSFVSSELLRVQVMRANSGGIPAGAIAGADGSGISPISEWQNNYESLTIEEPANPFTPNPANYEAGNNYVIIIDQMPEIEPLHFKLELFVGSELASDSNRLSSGGSVKARISRLESRAVETSFNLNIIPLGATSGLSASPMSAEVGYSDVDYAEYTFSSIFWSAASFNPAMAITISKVNPDDETVVLNSSQKAIWINL